MLSTIVGMELRQRALQVLCLSDVDQKVAQTLHMQTQAASFPIADKAPDEPLDLPGRPERPALLAHSQVARRSPATPAGRAVLLHAIAHIEFKAVMLLVLIVTLVCSFFLYVMYARGVFEPTQRLVLVSDDSEGVNVGMDLTFSGFPIGRVRQIELSPDGKARIVIDVPHKDAHWLRTTSIFTMERGMVGDTRIRAFSSGGSLASIARRISSVW